MPIVRLPKGELRDEIRQTTYDRIDFIGGVSPVGRHSFFTNTANKLLSESNLTQNGAFETAKSFRLQGLALDALNYNLANSKVLPIMLERSSLVLKIGEKDYWTGPGVFAAGRFWQDGITTVADTTILFQQFGSSAIQPVILQGRHAVDINPLQQFRADFVIEGLSAAEVALATPEADTVISVFCSLKGLLRRPVQ